MERKIKVHGCDDSTAVKMEMTDEQFAFIRDFAERVNKLGEQVHCKPSIRCEGDEYFYWSDRDEEESTPKEDLT